MKKGKAERAMAYVDEGLILEAMDKSDMEGKEERRAYMKRIMWKKWVAIAAAFAIIISGIAIIGGISAGGSVAVIALDVNPSLELRINKKEKVTDVYALNEEAVKVIGDMDLEGVDLDVAVNAIIGSMLGNGYLSADQNSILISVDSKNSDKGDKLRQKISAEIGELLKGQNINASVITQSFDKGGEESTKADENGISEAKSALISKIVASGLLDANGVPYTYEVLASLNVNELKLMLESKAQSINGIVASGTASGSRYIKADEALEKALADAVLTANDISGKKIEMDYDDDVRSMVYEIEFIAGGMEYDYEVHAESGAVLERDIEPAKGSNGNNSNNGNSNSNGEDNSQSSENASAASVIARDKALEIAYADAGVDAAAVRRPEIELDMERGSYVYEIEFKSGGIEYEYTLDAVSGRILEKDAERDD